MHIILFDIDGTLINTGGAGGAAVRAAMTSAFGIAQPSESVVFSGRTDRGIVGEFFHAHQVEDTPENWLRFRADYLRHLPNLLHECQGIVLPGIAALLESLARRNDLQLGLLTGNTRAGAQAKLAHFGLAHHFTFGGFGDNHTTRDDVAREALSVLYDRQNGVVNIDQVWVIGDTPLDIQCARAVGAKSIAVATGQHTFEELQAEKPDHIAMDFGDHAALLALWG